MNDEPTLEECAAYLVNRLDEMDRLLMKCGDAINNLDGRLLMVERLLAKVKHELDGKAYEESKLKWWN